MGRLGGGVYRVLPDRIETGFPVAAAISRGKIICRNAQPDTLDAVLAKLRDAGADIEVGEDWISLICMANVRAACSMQRTVPHPAFPTDMQAQFTLLNLVAEVLVLLPKRSLKTCSRMCRSLAVWGAHAEIESNTVICHGVEKLSGAQVMATDLRASASLVLAGCIAEGTTVVDRIHHIDRGYERIEDKLRALGANIQREASNRRRAGSPVRGATARPLIFSV